MGNIVRIRMGRAFKINIMFHNSLLQDDVITDTLTTCPGLFANYTISVPRGSHACPEVKAGANCRSFNLENSIQEINKYNLKFLWAFNLQHREYFFLIKSISTFLFTDDSVDTILIFTYQVSINYLLSEDILLPFFIRIFYLYYPETAKGLELDILANKNQNCLEKKNYLTV